MSVDPRQWRLVAEGDGTSFPDVALPGGADYLIVLSLPVAVPGALAARVRDRGRAGAVRDGPTGRRRRRPGRDRAGRLMAAQLRINNVDAIGPGDNVLVSWADVDNPSGTDWLGVWPSGQADAEGGTNRVAWRYTDGSSSGNAFLALPAGIAPGTYDVRLYCCDTHDLLAQIPMQVVAPIAEPPVRPIGIGPPAPPAPAAPAPSAPPAGGVDLAALGRNPFVLLVGAIVLARALG